MADQKKIYEEAYRTIPDYGSVNHGGRMQQYILDLNPMSVLDVGCGKGQFCEFLASKGKQVHGLDISAPFPDNDKVRWIRGDMLHIPVFSVEWITAFDVLEHIPEDEIDAVLQEFNRIAVKGFIFSICFRDSIYKIQGESLHPTVKPLKWWEEKLKVLGTVTILEEYDTYAYFRVDK